MADARSLLHFQVPMQIRKDSHVCTEHARPFLQSYIGAMIREMAENDDRRTLDMVQLGKKREPAAKMGDEINDSEFVCWWQRHQTCCRYALPAPRG